MADDNKNLDTSFDGLDPQLLTSTGTTPFLLHSQISDLAARIDLHKLKLQAATRTMRKYDCEADERFPEAEEEVRRMKGVLEEMKGEMEGLREELRSWERGGEEGTKGLCE